MSADGELLEADLAGQWEVLPTRVAKPGRARWPRPPLHARHKPFTPGCIRRTENAAMNAPATALNRFGLGARPDEPPPDNPQRWLLSQFEQYEPLPPVVEGDILTTLIVPNLHVDVTGVFAD